MLALKRLADAERDGDRIYAVIKGVGGSSDGRAKSMTAPHPDGQIRALNRAYEMAGYSPATRRAVRGARHRHGRRRHGRAGNRDAAARRKPARRRARHAIGSVKTLIGHTKATAGAAGLVKAVLALHHKVLPPHGDFDVPNPKLGRPVVAALPGQGRAALDRRRYASAARLGQRLRVRRHQFPRRGRGVRRRPRFGRRRRARVGPRSCSYGAAPIAPPSLPRSATLRS